MADEFESYRTTVLDTARRNGNQPPTDLFARYNMDPRAVGTPEEFSRRVGAVTKYWRALKLKKLYRAIAIALLAAHTDLERKNLLNLEAFTKQREADRGKSREQLDRRIEVIAGSSPCITLTGLRRLVAAVDNAFSEQEIKEALNDRGVSVIDPPWELPPGPATPAARSLRAPLTALGFRLSPEVVLGTEAVRAGFKVRDGFRLSGNDETITLADLERVRDEQTRTSQDERKTAMDNVIAILMNATKQPENVHGLILWEIREHLRADVEAGLPVRLIAHSATELGLDATEALHLAVTLAGDGVGGRRDRGTAQSVAEALAAGELQEARRLLDDVPPDECKDLRAQLDAALARVAELVAQADAAWSAGRTEDAASLLAAAAEVARDDETLHSRLAEIPPPPVGAVTAGIDRDRVVVRWDPSPARTGSVRYRVVRTDGGPAVSSAAGAVVEETSANEAVDTSVPAADPVHYTVFASRGGTWSTGSTADAVESLPAVQDVVLTADERSVTASWRAHPSATAVTVIRTSRSAPNAPPRQVPVRDDGGSSFADTDVRSGETYDYAFRAVYLTRSGTKRESEPVVSAASPTARPVAVTDLAQEVVQVNGAAVLRLTWRPPTSGAVEIRSLTDHPTWEVGSLVSRRALTTFGQPVGGVVRTGADGRALLETPVRHGRMTLTAVTLAGDHAAIGGTVSVTLVDAVTGVRADRLDDVVRLRWAWPRGAHLVRVRWWPDDGVDPPIHVEQSEVTARAHSSSGGAELRVGPNATVMSLQAVTRTRGEESASPAVLTRVRGRPTSVGYHVRLAGLPGRRRIDLTLTSDRQCRLPAIVVVHREDGIMPLRPDRGRVVAKFPSRNLAPGRPVSLVLPVRVSPLSGLACFVDPNSTDADEVTLVPGNPG